MTSHVRVYMFVCISRIYVHVYITHTHLTVGHSRVSSRLLPIPSAGSCRTNPLIVTPEEGGREEEEEEGGEGGGGGACFAAATRQAGPP